MRIKGRIITALSKSMNIVLKTTNTFLEIGSFILFLAREAGFNDVIESFLL